MSFALVTGNFGLYDARQTLVKAAGSTGPGTLFYLYSLTLQLSANNSSPMDGTVRVYAPASSQPVPDGTVVYIIAKVHIAADIIDAILEPIYFFPFPGDPDDEAYEGPRAEEQDLHRDLPLVEPAVHALLTCLHAGVEPCTRHVHLIEALMPLSRCKNCIWMITSAATYTTTILSPSACILSCMSTFSCPVADGTQTDDILLFRNSLIGEYTLLLVPKLLGMGLMEDEVRHIAGMSMQNHFVKATRYTTMPFDDD